MRQATTFGGSISFTTLILGNNHRHGRVLASGHKCHTHKCWNACAPLSHTINAKTRNLARRPLPHPSLHLSSMSDPTPPPPPARCTARATTFRPAQGSPESIPNHFNSDGTGHSERAAPRRLRARPATATATTTAQRSHYSKDRFFSTREPRHWSLAQYLDFCRMVCDFEGRRDVVNRYCRLIRNIAACDTANCCSEEHRRRAKALQKQYKRRVVGFFSLSLFFSPSWRAGCAGYPRTTHIVLVRRPLQCSSFGNHAGIWSTYIFMYVC